MDRSEAVLRELNLYPQWVRRNPPALEEPQSVRAELVEVCPAPTEIGVLCPSTTPLVLSEAEGSGRTEINNTHTGSSAVVPASQADNLDWPELKRRVRDCTACKLRAGCTQTVFGVGDESADWLFVGEGPGADEDARGEPFVGQAGKLLDNMLMAIKLGRGKNVYIANIVKCRPPGNRNPEADEIAACLPYLQRQIGLIKPKLIVALGKTAATALLGRDATLGSLRGTLHDFNGIPLLVTYHPAYLLRSPMEKAKAWQDLCLATDMMQKM
ncbi:MAG: uracil-DNA glycosylase [Nitrosomonadales bacterium]|nr:uracil-DNA glycosylase [Nitrosomonadales bacterium]